MCLKPDFPGPEAAPVSMPEQHPHKHNDTPVLTPPGQTDAVTSASARTYATILLALGALLVIGLVVILMLPQLVSTQPSTVSSNTPAVLPAGVDAQTVANKTMQSYLQLRAQLELENAVAWGEPQWTESVLSATQASRQLVQRQFGHAAVLYGSALQQLQQLEGQREQRIHVAMQQAQAALSENRVVYAIEQFQRVLAIDAEHEDARFGLARAQSRSSLLDSMTLGEQAESRGDLLAAQAAYQEAAMLDPEYEPPSQAFARVTDEMESLAFDDAMSRMLMALDQSQLGHAGKALAEAQALRPDDGVVRDAQQRLMRARQLARLNIYRQQAEKFTRIENWQAVLTVYKKILAVDATAGFALDGLEKAEARLAVNKQFDHYLKRPARLHAAQPLENAEALLAAIAYAPADEPRLANKISTLQTLVMSAQTPVSVALSSDGETDIAIYHVGQLGVFSYYQLDLLPGTYTVVGTRYGYRDVQKILKVTPGAQNAALSIRCEELI